MPPQTDQPSSSRGVHKKLETENVTTKPQYLTSQSSLEPFRLLVTQLVYSRRHARQPTGCEEGTRSVRDGFVGGRCGGAAPAQGRAEGPTAQNTTMRGERTPLFPSFRVANQLRLSSYLKTKNCSFKQSSTAAGCLPTAPATAPQPSAPTRRTYAPLRPRGWLQRSACPGRPTR